MSCLTSHREIYQNFTNAAPFLGNIAGFHGLSYIETAKSSERRYLDVLRRSLRVKPDLLLRAASEVVHAQDQLPS